MSSSTRSFRTLVVDDEQPARERLRRLLQTHAQLEIVGEAADGPEAMEQIAELQPDLIFIDIEMPGCSGLDVAASIGPQGPHIVFCTAYDQYAVDAFELNAVDYLLKPINRTRLQRTIERILATPSDAAAKATAQSTTLPKRFLARRGSRFYVVPADDVLYFGSEDGVTHLQTEEHQYWMQPTLVELEQRLDDATFFRVSRSAIVRLAAIREVLSTSGGQGCLRLVDESELEVSRRRFKPLIKRFEG